MRLFSRLTFRMTLFLWAISSVGRAPDLHSGGHRFEADMCPVSYGPLAQLVERLHGMQEVIGSRPICVHYSLGH